MLSHTPELVTDLLMNAESEGIVGYVQHRLCLLNKKYCTSERITCKIEVQLYYYIWCSHKELQLITHRMLLVKSTQFNISAFD